jgi:nucleoside-diphosphate-sugar epimerase
MTGTLLSLGFGYCAQALVRELDPGWRVIGTTRQREKAEALAGQGVEALLWPPDEAALAAALRDATHILASASPGEDGDPLLPTLAPLRAEARPRWVGYLSTTGVYGDHGGDWVDEDTAPAAGTERGARRLLAERQWQDLARAAGWPLHIFRLGGIYGPGRGPFGRLRAGTARRIVKPGQVFSRIHVADIAQALSRSMARPTARPGETVVWNLVDDDPAPPQDVIAEAARLLGMEPPPEIPVEDAGLSSMGLSFYAESKRVRNDRIRCDLGLTLRFPSYRDGLPALLADEAGAG